MWQQPVDDLLKLEAPKVVPIPNFNPFDILEPQKVNIDDHILVDLSTDENKPVEDNDSSLQMGSFIDTVTKSEYHLLDLYQNIYVTPQHIKKPSQKCTDTDNLIDFNDFSDKLENEDKGNSKDEQETKYSDQISKKSDRICDFDEIFDKMFESSIPKMDKVPYKELAEGSEVKFIESTNNYVKPLKPIDKNEMEITKPNHENINNMLSDQLSYQMNSADFTFKKHESELKNQHNLKRENFAYNESFKSGKERFLNTHQIHEQKIQEVKKNSDINQSERCCKCHNTRKITKTTYNQNTIDEPDLLHTFNNVFSLDHKAKYLKRPPVLNMLINNQFSCQIKAGQLLQTAIKDEKLYAKQQNILTNNNGLTKGPDIYEKSIVLPQIMERLAARKKTLDDQLKLKRRLVLDSGASTKHQDKQSIDGNVKSVVLMEDCNKFRLADLKVRTSFEKFVKTGTLHS